jgi:pimeloyl-ACP methyl ester carboxylesterase/protein-S-isoprenylcysteine O-methyltransferase Ste14
LPTPSPLLRALAAFLILPGLIAYAVPALLAWPIVIVRPAGVVVMAIGTLLLLWCARDFYVTGKGTLAPWDPPRTLVTVGLYRFSRNPMYVAIGVLLAGWALATGSTRLWLYAFALMVAFHLRVVFYEERRLADAHRAAWPRYRASVPRWIFPTRRALGLAIAAMVVAVPLAGLIFEAYMDGRTRREFPPPGMFVDVGGRQIHLLCIGEGSPIVFYEASGFGLSSMQAQTVRERVSSRTRVCSYDRPGMGWSDPAPSVLTVGELARDLAVLQDRASLPAPFLVVASSVGGLNAEMFARRYPERVAGLILLDAGTSQLVRAGLQELPNVPTTIGSAIVATIAQLGAVRLLDPFRMIGDSDDMRRARGYTYGGRAIGGLAALVRGRHETLRQFDEAPPLRADLPIAVLSASDPRMIDIPGLRDASAARSAVRLRGHEAFAKQSTRGTWKTIPNSEHLIYSSNPDVVIDEIFAMLDQLAGNR